MSNGLDGRTDIEKENIRFIKEHLRFKRDLCYYSHFLIYLLPAFIIYLGFLVFYFGRIKHDTDTHIGNFLPMLIITAGVALAAFFQNRIKQSERFEVIPASRLDFPALEETIRQQFKVRDIQFHATEEMLSVRTKLQLPSWSENITIIKTNEGVLVNSRPTGSLQPAILFKNRKKMEDLKIIIQKNCSS